MPPPVDITGQKFGRLTALRATNRRNPAGSIIWECLCDCGSTHEAASDYLRRNQVRSCGCLHADFNKSGKAGTTHGMAKTPIYHCWASMIQRCTNPGHEAYPRYGGRGVGVCDRWLAFENFYADVGARPDGASLERLDNNKGYEPGNVAWADARRQANNRRSNRLLEFRGETKTLAEWCRVTGLGHAAILKRLYRGWSIERALTTPSGAANDAL